MMHGFFKTCPKGRVTKAIDSGSGSQYLRNLGSRIFQKNG